VELTLGARWYDIAVDLEGSANGAYGNKGADTDPGGGGANLSVQYGPNNPNGYPDKAETDGVIGKATLSWNPTEDTMYYVTWSEGLDLVFLIDQQDLKCRWYIHYTSCNRYR
jgi:outer membrane receptor protein involved in Fe transport